VKHSVPEIRISRRSLLHAGGMGMLGLGLNRLSALGASANKTSIGLGKAKSVIMIFNGGAPSHIDLWDPKPDGPSEIRGEFRTIRSNVPGIHVTELLPQMAKRMDKLAVIRSVHHGHSSHNGGMHWATTGRPYRVDSTLITPSPTDLPGVGTLVGWLAQRDGFSKGVPPYVITPFPHCDSKVYLTPGQFGGCLGTRFDPYVLDDDPNAATFRVRNMGLDASLTPARLQERLALLNQMSAAALPISTTQTAQMDIFNEQATAMLQSGKAANAFDLTKEPDKVRRTCWRGAWSNLVRGLSRRSTGLPSPGIRTRTTSTGSRTGWCRRWSRPTPPYWMIWKNAACWKARWSCGWASLDARRRSTMRQVAITGRAVTASFWPAVVCAAGRSSGVRMPAGLIRKTGL
jgi:hypothetical protein